jgi:hypothetical protein
VRRRTAGPDGERDHVHARITTEAVDINGLDPLVWQRVDRINEHRDLP